MSFMVNLLKKIRVEFLCEKIIKSIDVMTINNSIDFASVQELLKYSFWSYFNVRNLHLYMENGVKYGKILVLDNALKIYDSYVDDVLFRKNPSIREVFSLYNIIKILDDKDITFCNGKDSVEFVKNLCISDLNFTFYISDIEKMSFQGKIFFQNNCVEKVIEIIASFAAILGFVESPEMFSLDHSKIWGVLKKNLNNYDFGPIIVYNLLNNSIYYSQSVIISSDMFRFDILKYIASGKKYILCTNESVFEILKTDIITKMINKKIVLK